VERLLEELDGGGKNVIIIPSQHEPGNIYKMMTGFIVPRPIAFVSTMSSDGQPNLAPFSFFTAASANPPIVCFCPVIRGGDGKKKDTLNNIEAVREFVINLVSEDLAVKMNEASYDYPPGVDEFKVSGLTAIPSDVVSPPRVKESKVALECKLVQIVHVSNKPLGGSIVLGEVLRFHVLDELFDNYRIDPDRLHAIGRMGGPTYVRTTDRFELQRPTRPLPL
jgi:flavin reductase (DIM6/NTAB) family NADH-FMN oxidoreductase RutF